MKPELWTYLVLSTLLHFGGVLFFVMASSSNETLGHRQGGSQILSFSYVSRSGEAASNKSAINNSQNKKRAADAPAAKPAAGSQAQSLESVGRDESPYSDSVLSSYLWSVRREIEKKKFYPLSARRLNHRGAVEVAFVIDRNGKVLEIEKVESAYQTLSSAARDLLLKQVRFEPFPAELSAETLHVSFSIQFELN